MIFCSIATLSHLYRAKALAISLKVHYPEAQFILALVEKENTLDEPSQLYFDDVVLARDLGVEQLTSWMFRYEANEASCSLKGELLTYMLSRFPDEQQFVYLDSDMQVYSRMTEVEQALMHHAIVITPHTLGKPDASSAFFGIYNTGFLAIRRSVEAVQFIEWWREKLRYDCYIDRQRGIFLDQSWLNHIPAHIPTYSLANPAYNVAFWNLHEQERAVTLAANGKLLIGGTPLRCFHFSHVFDSLVTCVNQMKREVAVLLKAMYHDYVVECEVAGMEQFMHAPWSYGCYHDGSKIDRCARIHYRQNPSATWTVPDPFAGYGRELVAPQASSLSPSPSHSPSPFSNNQAPHDTTAVQLQPSIQPSKRRSVHPSKRRSINGAKAKKPRYACKASVARPSTKKGAANKKILGKPSSRKNRKILKKSRSRVA